MARTQDGEVRRGFASVGVKVDDGVLAYKTPSPTIFPPFSNWGSLVTRHRVITRSGSKLTLWVAYSGPTPGRKLGEFAAEDLRVRTIGRRWDSISLAGVDLWTRAADRPTIAAWRGLAPT